MIGRRASASLIRRSSSALFSCLSTSSPSSVCYHNFVDKIDNEIAGYSNEVVPVPSGFPFNLYAPLGKDKILMAQRYQKQHIRVHILDRLKYQVNGDPYIPFYVRLVKKNLKVISLMTAKPGQINIHEVTVSKIGRDCSDDDFIEYIKSKGITSKTISFLYDRLGYNLKNASATPENSSHDGLPFDSVTEEHGTVTRETKDEIIEIEAYPYNFEYHEESDDEFVFGFDDLYGYDDDYDHVEDDDDDYAGCCDGGSNGGCGVGGSESGGGNDDGGGNQMAKEGDGESNGAPSLEMHVVIRYGDNFNRCLKFEGFVSPENCGTIYFDQISFRIPAESGGPSREYHLDEFEEFYKKRGIEPCNFDFLFNLMDKRDQMNKDVVSSGRIPGGHFLRYMFGILVSYGYD